jgi:hypothetical protein
MDPVVVWDSDILGDDGECEVDLDNPLHPYVLTNLLPAI